MKQLALKDGRVWMTVLNQADEEFSAGEEYDAEMTIRGLIGQDWYGNDGYSEKQFASEIQPLKGKRVLLNLHSQGGNIWDAFAIHGMVKNHGKVDTRVMGIAASSADLIFQAGATRIMPKLAMRMAHNPSGAFYAEGNATELREKVKDLKKTADRLDKHSETLAQMYADRSGNSVEKCRSMMDEEEFMDGEESKERGFCDVLSDDEPVQDELDLTPFKNASKSEAVINYFNTATSKAAGNKNNKQQECIVNKDQKIALLKSWGVKIMDNATDAWLDDTIAKGKPAAGIGRTEIVAVLKGWGVTVQDNATDEQLQTMLAAGKPSAAPVQPSVVNLDNHPAVVEMRKKLDAQRRKEIRNTLETYVGEGRIPAAQIQAWEDDAFAAGDNDNGNPVLNRLGQLPKAQPGIQPVVADISADGTIAADQMVKAVGQLMAPRNAMLQGRATPADRRLREDLSQNSVQCSRMIRQQIESITNNVPENDNTRRAEVISGMLDSFAPMNDTTYGAPNTSQGAGSGGASVSSDLQRQVIMSEAMRAFRRRLVSLSTFAHKFERVPLEGTDQIVVPYYPLFTTGSSRFTASGGYKFQNTDQATSKKVTVGGAGPDTKVAGRDRAYQAMTWSAYLLRRQPWFDVVKAAVMRGEQLALDITNDIITAWILKANFGNCAWAGLPGAFDETIVAQLAGISDKLDWPENMKNLVIGTDYWVNLASSPYVKAYLNIGDTNTIREGRIGGLYGFEDTIKNPRIPVTADTNLIGWMCYPSALLVATAPILPAPGELKLMLNYDLVTDDQTGLTFEYKYWGEPWNSADREIIESNYGSDLGELAALRRLVASGS